MQAKTVFKSILYLKTTLLPMHWNNYDKLLCNFSFTFFQSACFMSLLLSTVVLVVVLVTTCDSLGSNSHFLALRVSIL
jgi:hypothetical protein